MTFRFTWNCWIIKHLLYCRLVAMWMPKWITFSWSNRLVGWLAGWLKCAHCHSLNRIFIKCMYIYIYNVCVCVYLNIELMRFQTTHLCWIWNAISFNAINRIIAFNGPKYFVVMTSARTHARTQSIESGAFVNPKLYTTNNHCEIFQVFWVKQNTICLSFTLSIRTILFAARLTGTSKNAQVQCLSSQKL